MIVDEWVQIYRRSNARMRRTLIVLAFLQAAAPAIALIIVAAWIWLA